MAISIWPQLKWTSASQLLRISFQTASAFSLARVLSPSDYGLMAIVGIVTAFAGLFRDFGTGAALIQRKEIDDELCQAVFAFNVLLGASLTIILCAIALPVSYFFNEEQISSLIFAVSPVFLFASFGIVHYSLLERNYSYRKIFLIELVSGFLSLFSAIICALNGLGAYSLVVQALLAALVSSVFVWHLAEWRATSKICLPEIRRIWKFSFDNFVFGFVNYFHRNADSIIIGRWLGPHELGFYSIAYKILLLPVSNITSVVNRASFVVYSRQQDNKAQIGEHYIRSLKNIGLLTAVLMGSVWGLREPLIFIMLGENWIKSAELLAWLAPVGYLQSMVSTSGSVFNSIGRADLLRNMGLIGTPFFLVTFFIGMNWGVMGVAAAYFFANVAWIFPVLLVVFKQLELSAIRLVELLFLPLLLGALFACSLRIALLYCDWAVARSLTFWG